jgi:hypothetical protein
MDSMQRFIRRENLVLFKNRLAEAHNATQHKMFLKLKQRQRNRSPKRRRKAA